MKDEWINVSDELPKVGVSILAYLDFNKVAVMMFTDKHEFKSPHHDHSGWSTSVTHWMELPKKP